MGSPKSRSRSDVEMQPGAGIDHRYRADIDGLRAVAVIMVVGYHVGLPGFSGGFVGVDVFFVISGYLIVGRLARELSENRTINWPAFYVRRVRRLLPAQLLMLAVVLLMTRILLFPTGEVQAVSKSAIAAAGFASNLYFWKWEPVGYFAGQNLGSPVLLHTWSLAVEEQFYLALAPAVLTALWLARRRRWPVSATLLAGCGTLTVVSLASAVWSAEPHSSAAFYLPVTRAYEFGLGAILALAPRLRPLPRKVARVVLGAGLLVLAAVTWLPLPSEGFPSYWALIPGLATLMLLWAGADPVVRQRSALAWRPLVAVGVLSYGWYLWHWPLLTIAASVNLAPPPLWARTGMALGALGIAYLSHRFWERRFYRRPGDDSSAVPMSVTRRPWRALAVGAACTALVAGAAAGIGWWARTVKSTPEWSGLTAQLEDTPAVPATCEDMIAPSASPEPAACYLKPYRQDQPTLVLWGDSHAWHLIPALMAAASNEPVNLVSWVWPGCAPMAQPESVELVDRLEASDTPESMVAAADDCASNNRGAVELVDQLLALGPAVGVVMSARWEPYLGQTGVSLLERRQAPAPGVAAARTVTRSVVPRGVTALYDELTSARVEVTVVGPTPELERSAPQCLRRELWFECDIARTRVDAHQRIAWAWLESILGPTHSANLIDLNDSFCDEDRCRAGSQGVVSYFDDDHLSASRARLLADDFRPVVASLLRDSEPRT